MKKLCTIAGMVFGLSLLTSVGSYKSSNPIKRQNSVEPTTTIQVSSSIEQESSSDIQLTTSTSVSGSDTVSPLPGDDIDPDTLFTDFQSFIDWFADVVLPWLVAFFTSGGAGVLIFQIAKMVANQLKVKKVVAESTEELTALRDKYTKTLESVKSRDELLARLIDSVLNESTKSELRKFYDELPSLAELEVSKVTEKIKLKVKKKKAAKVVTSNDTMVE